MELKEETQKAICSGVEESLNELKKLKEDPFPEDVATALLDLIKIAASKGDLTFIEFTALLCASLLDVGTFDHFMDAVYMAKPKTILNAITYSTMNGLEL